MKKYKFLLFIFLLGFIFIPKDVFAQNDTNTITMTSQEFYWHGLNTAGVEETHRFNSTQNHFYKWGSSTATYQLIRFAPLIYFNSLGVETSYKARVAFYVITKYPFSYDNKFCTAFSGSGEKYSCSLHREMEDQIGSSEVMLTFVYDYEWTSSTNYIEFWLNFDNFKSIPTNTEFGYTIIDFQGNVSGSQIILDGLGQTNKKLDIVKDAVKDGFNECGSSDNLFNAKYYTFGKGNDDPSYHIINNNEISIDFRGSWDRLTIDIRGLKPNTTYTLSSYLDKPTTNYLSGFHKSGEDLQNNAMRYNSGEIYYTFTTDSTGNFPGLFYGVWGDTSTPVTMIYKKIMLNEGSSPKDFEPFGEICKNRLDKTNEKLDQLNSFISDDSAPNSDISSLGNVQGLLPPGPVDSLLNIPFKFLSIVISSFGDLCVPMSLNWVFNSNLTIPCFGDVFYDNVPIYLMIFINLIPSGFILISYLKHLYKKVERATSLETTSDDEWGVL